MVVAPICRVADEYVWAIDRICAQGERTFEPVVAETVDLPCTETRKCTVEIEAVLACAEDIDARRDAAYRIRRIYAS